MINMDERGFACPLPVVHVKKAIEEAKEGDEILVKVNDNVKLENIKRLCSSKGCKFSVKENAKDDMDIRIIRSRQSRCFRGGRFYLQFAEGRKNGGSSIGGYHGNWR